MSGGINIIGRDNLHSVEPNSDGSVNTQGAPLTVKIADPYYGFALPGTASAATAWQIKKVEATGVTWASGTASFDKVWDSRAGYTYS